MELDDSMADGDGLNSLIKVLCRAAQNLLDQSSKKPTFKETWLENVAKLYDSGQLVGTVTLIENNLALTAFHNIYDEKRATILEKTLSISVKSADYSIKHVVSYPAFDFSVYRVQGIILNSYFKLGVEGIHSGDSIFLLSYPAFDKGDCNEAVPIVSHGVVSQMECPPHGQFCLGDYQCFPCCSGGAVIMEDKLVGLHLATVYHVTSLVSGIKDDSSFSYDAYMSPVRNLHWSPSDAGSSRSNSKFCSDHVTLKKNFRAPMDTKDVLKRVISSVNALNLKAEGVAKNCSEQGHLASFIPAAYIKGLLGPFREHKNRASKRRRRCS